MTPKPSSPGIWTSRKTRSGSSSSISLQGFQAVLGGADDLDVREFPEQVRQLVAGELFVVRR